MQEKKEQNIKRERTISRRLGARLSDGTPATPTSGSTGGTVGIVGAEGA
jgi:hypothetical protein